VSTSGVTTHLNLVYTSTVADFVNFNATSPPGNLVTTLNDVDDTAAFADADLGIVTPAFGRTSMRTNTTVTPPNNFPDPPIVTTTTLTETITIDPISLPIDFASSATAPIGYVSFLRLYGFSSNVGISLPSSFNVTGTYKVEGPTQTITQAFSIPFNRTSAGSTFNGRWNGFIQVGSNYPDTAQVGAADITAIYPGYLPATPIIFQGTVDGVPVTARFTEARPRITLPNPVPEPMSSLLCAAGLAVLSISCARWTARAQS
jgi:hypothetical protein